MGTAKLWLLVQASLLAGLGTAEVFQQFELGQSKTSTELEYVLSKYLDNHELEQQMHGFTARKECAKISQVFSIGKSRNGTDIWCLEISNHPGVHEAKPNFKYVANMHGDEPSGRVLLMALAEWLCTNWRTNKKAKKMVEEVKLYLVPTLNPDGFATRSRGNTAGVDLNRDFPDPILNPNLEAQGSEQPETLAIMDWIRSRHFVASASMHEGAFVANYPWDGVKPGGKGANVTADDATFKYLARSYASLDPEMDHSSEFQEGITNGAQWYPLWGGMQDWNYLVGKCMELTLELSFHKWPREDQLPRIWDDNLKSLLNFPLTAIFGGLRGSVKGVQSSEGEQYPLAASVTVLGSNWSIDSSPEFGDFYRPLAPGSYEVLIEAKHHVSQTVSVIIPEDNTGLQRDFTLILESHHYSTSNPRSRGHKALPRKLDGFNKLSADPTTIEDQELLISHDLWISMMQIAMYMLLGVVLSALSVLLMLFLLRRYSRTHQGPRN